MQQLGRALQRVVLTRIAPPPLSLKCLMDAVNSHHVHPQLGYQVPVQSRGAKRLRKLPANFALDGPLIPPPQTKSPLSVLRRPRVLS
jgi:hypothetical protein